MMNGTAMRLCLVIILGLFSIAKSLVFVIKPHDEECFYLEKEKDDRLDFLVLCDGHDIDVTAYKPDGTPFVQQYNVKQYEHYTHDVANVTGDFRFCFLNTYNRNDVAVEFEYDRDEKHLMKPNFEEDKDKLMTRALRNMRTNFPSLMNNTKVKRSAKMGLFYNILKFEKKDNDTRALGSVAVIGLYFDFIENHLQVHRNQINRHHYLQAENGYSVMFYSILISCAMVVSTCTQLVIVKGFFNGKMSLKVWSFK